MVRDLGRPAAVLAGGLAVLLTVLLATPSDAAEGYVSKVMGHRGGPQSSGLPGNTLATFAWLADHGHVLEADARMTRDRQFVFSHDDTVGDRCEGEVRPRITQMTFAEVRRMRCHGGAYQITSLAEVLALLRGRPDVKLFLESKHSRQTRRAAARQNRILARKVRDAQLGGGRVLFQDFRYDVLNQFRTVMPGATTVYLDRFPSPGDVSRAGRLGAAVYSYDIRFLDPALNAQTLALDMQVNIWTVQTVAGARRAFAAGADSISTDDPVAVAAALDAGSAP